MHLSICFIQDSSNDDEANDLMFSVDDLPGSTMKKANSNSECCR